MRAPIDGPIGSMEGWARPLTSKEEKANQQAIKRRMKAGKKRSKAFMDGQVNLADVVE